MENFYKRLSLFYFNGETNDNVEISALISPKDIISDTIEELKKKFVDISITQLPNDYSQEWEEAMVNENDNDNTIIEVIGEEDEDEDEDIDEEFEKQIDLLEMYASLIIEIILDSNDHLEFKERYKQWWYELGDFDYNEDEYITIH